MAMSDDEKDLLGLIFMAGIFGCCIGVIIGMLCAN